MHHFGIDLPHHSVKMAAQQPPRHRDGAGRKGCDLARRLQRDGIDRGGFDHFIDDAGFSRLLGRKRVPHHQHLERARIAHAHRRQQARRRFRDQRQLQERRGEGGVGRGDDVIAVEQQGGADADGKAADRGDQRLLVVGQRL